MTEATLAMTAALTRQARALSNYRLNYSILTTNWSTPPPPPVKYTQKQAFLHTLLPVFYTFPAFFCFSTFFHFFLQKQGFLTRKTFFPRLFSLILFVLHSMENQARMAVPAMAAGRLQTAFFIHPSG
jgi:hypothetical protein